MELGNKTLAPQSVDQAESGILPILPERPVIYRKACVIKGKWQFLATLLVLCGLITYHFISGQIGKGEILRSAIDVADTLN